MMAVSLNMAQAHSFSACSTLPTPCCALTSPADRSAKMPARISGLMLSMYLASPGRGAIGLLKEFASGRRADQYRAVLFGFHRAIVGSCRSVQRIVELEGVMRVHSGKNGKRPFGYN